MTIKELKAELDCFDEDADVVFEFDDEIYVDSWTEDRYGMKKVKIDTKLKPTFICEYHGDCNIDLGVEN